MAFDLVTAPNHLSHIVGPGVYLLDISVAAENSKPLNRVSQIRLNGAWDAGEVKMLRDFVGIADVTSTQSA